jgi:tRNA A-37 threonylcarbamoyl transferase component Bud32/tetratricopeptide (TPR) repeat protein
LDFVGGGGEREPVEIHLAGCERCRVTVSRLVSGPRPALRSGPPLVRGDAVDRYVVLEVVGEGAMGRVYAAYDPVLDRKVALKLLYPRGDAPETRARQLREAKALARVAHPNLVAVHDAGVFGDSVFITMEFVDGQTLRAWLSTRREPKEIVAVFAQAGLGLAAVHAAGLVHRDFKPDNVLVGHDRRVRVSDFGLAREVGERSAPEGRASSNVEVPSASVVETALVGTPAYMAPEVLEGGRADARSDQFAFCVALFEALTDERPFEDNTLEEVQRGVTFTGPSALQQVLRRGLAASPADRFPSMDELVRALAPRTRRAVVSRGALVVVALLALSLFGAERLWNRSQLCTSGPAQVAAVWTPGRRAALEQHFTALGGQPSLAAMTGALDAWAGAWAQQHREACEATRVRGEQSDQLLAARMACLSRRLDEVGAVLDVLDSTDATTLPRAHDAVLSLTPLSVCSNATALLSPTPRPESPAVKASVEAVERELSKARALKDAARFTEGLAVATAAGLEAHRLAWPPLEAEALLLRGELLHGAGALSDAERPLKDAWSQAHLARDDRRGVEIAVALSFLCIELTRLDEAAAWAWQGRVLAARLDDWDLDALLTAQEGQVAFARADYAAAEPLFRRAWDLRRQHQGPSHVKTISLLSTLANTLGAQGHFDAALGVLRDVARQLEAALGRGHPKVGQAHHAVAAQLMALQRPAEALKVLDAILPDQERALGAGHQAVARLLLNRSAALFTVGRLDDALTTNARAQASFERANMPLLLGITLNARGTMLCEARRFDEGLATLERARAVLRPVLVAQPEDVLLTSVREAEGECLLGRGDAARALALFEGTLATRLQTVSANDRRSAPSRSGLGRAQLALGQRAQGLENLTRAVRDLEASHLDDALLAKSRAALSASK